jgi:5-hydroxyisourate hydrolase-like protein (transthyretin family)
MIATRLVLRPGWAAIGLTILGSAAFLASAGPARARSAPQALGPDPRPGAPAAEETPVRAYDQPAPESAGFRTGLLTVLDDETGRPLADAMVRILHYVDTSFHVFPTDSRGRLRFDYAWLGERPSGHIEVRRNGYVPVRYAWGAEGGPSPPDALTLRIRRGLTIGGIVVAAADRPVEGVTVVATVTRYGPGRRAPLPDGQEMYYEVPSRTGPDGRWRSDSVPPGAEEVSLQLIHPDFVSDGSTTLGWKGRTPKLAALRDQSDRQVLLKGVKISGRVVDDQGRPIAGTRVVDTSRQLGFLEYVWRASTDAEGRFHIHLARGDGVHLTVQARGYQPAARQVAADPDLASVEFRLPPGKRLRGRVVDTHGRPVAGAQVILPSTPSNKGIFFNTRTDAQGRFEWDSAPEGNMTFSIGAEGYLSGDYFPLTASDNEAVITFRPAVDIRLEAVDAGTREPIPRVLVRMGTPVPGTREFRWGPRIGSTAPRKYHKILEADEGPYLFEVAADGYLPEQMFVAKEWAVIRAVI